jgi:hypothetical protein
MTMMSIPAQRRWEPAVPVAALTVAWTGGWPGTCAVAGAVALTVVYRLLAEQSRRRLLLDIYLHAPAGTEVVQDDGSAGPAMRVRVGNGSRPGLADTAGALACPVRSIAPGSRL